MAINVSIIIFYVDPMLLPSVNPFKCHEEVFKKNLNASKPSEHPPQVEECLKV